MRPPSLFWCYLGLAALGTLLPYSQLIPWFAEQGFDPRGFIGWDVIVSAIVLLLFILVQGRRDRVPHLWMPVAGTLLVGVSCGLPLFLALRERAPASGESGARAET